MDDKNSVNQSQELSNQPVESPRPALEQGLAALAEHAVPESKSIECPLCHGTFYGSYVATVPEKQRVSFVIQHDSGALSAKTLGGVIVESEKLLRMVAKDVGAKVHVFVDSLEHSDQKTSIGFFITAVRNGNVAKTQRDPSVASTAARHSED